MALIRSGTTKIRTGASKVMRQAPPQRVTRRATPQKEIAFISERKKLEEATKDTAAPAGLTSTVQQIKDSGTKGAEAGFRLTQALSRLYGDEIKRIRTKAYRDARSEYIKQVIKEKPGFEEIQKLQKEKREAPQVAADKFISGVVSTLPAELQSWYNKQVSDYNKLMKDCDARYKAELEEIKDKYGKDPRKYTDQRLKLKAKIYPDWSSDARQAEEKLEERHGKLAKAISVAKKAGIKDISYDELHSMATSTKATAKKQAKEKGITDKQLAAIRGEKYVEELPTVTTTEALPVKVINATTEEIEKAEKAKAEADARGWACYTTIQIFKVKLSDGRTILVEALDSPSRSGKASAESKAKAAGYKVAWVTKQMAADKAPEVKTTTIIKPGTVTTLKDKDIPREWRMASAEVRESMGVKKVDGKWQQTMIATAEGEFIPKKVYDELPDKYQELLVKEGMDAYHEAAEKDRQKFQDWLKDLKDDYPGLYKVYEEKGYDALEEAIKQQAAKQKDVISTLDKSYKLDEGYDITKALIDKAVTADDLKLAGFKDDDIKTANKAAQEVLDLEKEFLARSKDSRELITRMALTPEPQRSAVLKEAGKGNEASWIVDKKYNELTTDEKLKVLERYESQVKPGALAVTGKYLRTVAEPIVMFTPVVGTVAYWNKMEPWERALSIAGDIACVAFVVQAGAAAARAAKGYTAASRIKAAATGAKGAILAEAAAPVEMVAHPIQTTKGIGKQIRSAIETLAHPKKVPLGGVELSYTTTRLPVDDVGGAKKAMELRDAAVAAAIRGKPGKATVGKVTLELKPTELQKVGGAIALHQTPDIRPFLNGAVVKGGTEGSGLFISPNFHSRFAQATAFGDIPEGGIKGGLIIRDEKVLKTLVPSGKIYRSTAEIEAVLKPGTKLPAPSQVLFTRDIAGNKLTFLVIGKPYTQAQIAKLKLLGSLDTMAQVFKPTMKLTGAERKAITAMDNIIELAEERAKLARQLEAARTAGKAEVVRTLNQRIGKLDDRIDTLVKRVNAPREAIRPDNLAWAQYADKGILERYQELSPKRARATDRGTRLPAIRPALAMRAAAARARAKVTGKEPYVSVKYEKGEAPGYAPGYAPTYTPAKAPPYAPARVPPKPPPPTPPYTPTYAPPYVPPRVPPPEKPPKYPPRRPPKPIKLEGERLPRQADSLITWRQGMYYITVVEPYRTTGQKPDVLYSRQKPPWAKKATGKRSPQRTLKTIGKVPKSIKLGMGPVVARVKHGKLLRFHRRRG